MQISAAGRSNPKFVVAGGRPTTRADQLRERFEEALTSGAAVPVARGKGLDITPPRELGTQWTAFRRPNSFFVIQKSTTTRPELATLLRADVPPPVAVPEFIRVGGMPVSIPGATRDALAEAEREGKVVQLASGPAIDITPPREHGVKWTAFPGQNAMWVLATSTTQNPQHSTLFRVPGAPPAVQPR
jgi:hypothetical protein